MTSLKFVFVIGVLAVNLRYTRALSQNEVTKIKEMFTPFVNQCRKELKLSDVLMSTAGPTFNIEPCFMYCVFEKSEVINDKGLFDVDKTANLIKKYLLDVSDQTNALQIIHFCKKVNDRHVTDGDKRCKRAGFLFQCLIPYKKVFID